MIYSIAKLELRTGIWSDAAAGRLARRLARVFGGKRPYTFAAKSGGVVILIGNTGLALWEVTKEIEQEIDDFSADVLEE